MGYQGMKGKDKELRVQCEILRPMKAPSASDNILSYSATAQTAMVDDLRKTFTKLF